MSDTVSCDDCNEGFGSMADFAKHLPDCPGLSHADEFLGADDGLAPPRSFQGDPEEVGRTAEALTQLYGELREAIAALPNSLESQQALIRLEESAYWATMSFAPQG